MSRTWAGCISVHVLCVQCDVRAHSSVRQLLIGAAAHRLALRTRRHVAAHCNMVRGVEACPSRCDLRCRQRPTLRARSSSTRFRSAARYRPPHATGTGTGPSSDAGGYASCCTGSCGQADVKALRWTSHGLEGLDSLAIKARHGAAQC